MFPKSIVTAIKIVKLRFAYVLSLSRPVDEAPWYSYIIKVYYNYQVDTV